MTSLARIPGDVSARFPFRSPIPDRVGPYMVVRYLGHGGTAVVVVGRLNDIGREIALKVLRAAGRERHQETRRFRREIRTLARLSHPGLVRILDAGFDGEWVYYAMECMEGGTLESLLGRGPIPVAEALRILHPLADAVGYLHEAGVIHRDIKPSNVLLDRLRQPKLSDLGLMQQPEITALTGPDQLLGTVPYLPPEVFSGLPVSPASDVYQLAAILFEMITGRRLVARGSAQTMIGAIIRGEHPRLSSVVPGVDPRLDDLVQLGLSRDHRCRPQDGREFAGALTRLLDDATNRPTSLGIPVVTRPVPGEAPPAPAEDPVVLADHPALMEVLGHPSVLETLKHLRAASSLGLRRVTSRPDGPRTVVLTLHLASVCDAGGRPLSNNQARFDVHLDRGEDGLLRVDRVGYPCSPSR